MGPYTAILATRFRLLLQYRAAALAGLGTQVFWGWVRAMMFAAFYAASAAEHPMTLPEVITYVWLGQGLLRLLPFGPEPEVTALVRSGNVAYELARPIDLYGLWYARCLAHHTAPTLLRAVPMFLLAWPFFGMSLPPTASAGAAFAVSVAAAVLLSAAVTTLLCVILLRTLDPRGLVAIVGLAAWLASGFVVPLPLFPRWSQQLLDLLPYRGIIDIPFRLYLGHLPAADLPWLVAFQLGWTAALVLLTRMYLSRITRRIVVQGG